MGSTWEPSSTTGFPITRRFPANETIQIIFKVFKYVLKLQLDTLESEGAVLGDLHEQNITVMGGETREGPEGRVPGAEKLTFAVVDCSRHPASYESSSF